MDKQKKTIHSDDYFGVDPPEVRQVCLNCEKPKCNNCMNWCSKARRTRNNNAKEKKKKC